MRNYATAKIPRVPVASERPPASPARTAPPSVPQDFHNMYHIRSSTGTTPPPHPLQMLCSLPPPGQRTKIYVHAEDYPIIAHDVHSGPLRAEPIEPKVLVTSHGSHQTCGPELANEQK
eukprot:6375432-Amphidinium_carterae.1